MLRLTGLLIALALLTLACGDSTEGKFGGELYEISCSRCHGSSGGGGVGPAIASDPDTLALSDEQIAGVIRVGPGRMPSHSRFTDEQIDSLVIYIRQLQAPHR
jgi:mono/diheme cytochrome c family protein